MMVDPRELLASLGIEPSSVSAVTSGRSGTGVWRVTAQRDFALRVFQPIEADDCEREQLAMQVAARARVPVPAIHHAGCYHTTPYVLMDWSPGVPVLDVLRGRPHRAHALGREFGRMQARLHAVATGGQLRENWIDWPCPPAPAIRERLEQCDLQSGALLHLDFHPINVLTDRRQITAIIDWSNVHGGDPRADLARTFTLLALYPGSTTFQRAVTSLIRRRFLRGWWEGYTELAGRPVQMSAFVIWAGSALASDFAGKLGRPETGFSDHYLEAEVARIRQATARWAHRAGVELPG